MSAIVDDKDGENIATDDGAHCWQRVVDQILAGVLGFPALTEEPEIIMIKV